MVPGSPIQHVVIIVKENHAFDNYFGQFPGCEEDSTLDPCPNPPDVSPQHDHQAWLERADHAVHEQYTRENIPSYFAYAKQFTLCDHYFTDVAGPSTPNHLMLIAADSPLINNPHHRDPIELQPPFDLPSLPASLESARLDWRNYGGYAFRFITSLRKHHASVKSEQFVLDATAGNLPAVSWVYAPTGFSEHPKDDITEGEAWTVTQVKAVIQGGLWPSTAIFITWDDWGGWFDHVRACECRTVGRWDTVPLRATRWLSGTQSLCQERIYLPGAPLSREPGQILRDDIWPQATECSRCRRR